MDYLEHLLPSDWDELEKLDQSLRSHNGVWGQRSEPIRYEDGSFGMPYVTLSPIVQEFIKTMYNKGLVPAEFNWSKWQEGDEWLARTDAQKYDQLSPDYAVQLIALLIRRDRFVEGTLLEAFNNKVPQKLLSYLVAHR